MKTNRRNFLKLGLAGMSAALLHQFTNVEKAIASPSKSVPEVEKKAALFDVTKCVGCRACQNACKHHNNMPADCVMRGFFNLRPISHGSSSFRSALKPAPATMLIINIPNSKPRK